MSDLTGVAYPKGVAEPSEEDTQKEDSKQENKDDTNVTERHQKDKDHQSFYFDVNKDLPERRGYKI